jgi:hypothetical protein
MGIKIWLVDIFGCYLKVFIIDYYYIIYFINIFYYEEI